MFDNIYRDGTALQKVLQGGFTEDYASQNIMVSKRAVILEVLPSDDPSVVSAREQDDLRGYTSEATVLLVDDMTIISGVLITPPSPSGLDNFHEILPRGSTASVQGLPFDGSLGGIDPFSLDGDWCIVSFLDGNIDSPYISCWLPNPQNRYDVHTSGSAYPSMATGEGTALDQSGRYFRRINGVEVVVTKLGDTIITTDLGGTELVPGADATEGRFPRTSLPSKGGGVKLQLKPSASLEFSFKERVDGVGVLDNIEDSLPQKQPPQGNPQPPDDDNCYVVLDKNAVEINVPLRFTVNSMANVQIEATDQVDVTSDVINLKADTGVNVGSDTATEPLVLGDTLDTILSALTVSTPMGPSGTPLNAATFPQFKSTKNKVD